MPTIEFNNGRRLWMQNAATMGVVTAVIGFLPRPVEPENPIDEPISIPEQRLIEAGLADFIPAFRAVQNVEQRWGNTSFPFYQIADTLRSVAQGEKPKDPIELIRDGWGSKKDQAWDDAQEILDQFTIDASQTKITDIDNVKKFLRRISTSFPLLLFITPKNIAMLPSNLEGQKGLCGRPAGGCYTRGRVVLPNPENKDNFADTYWHEIAGHGLQDQWETLKPYMDRKSFVDFYTTFIDEINLSFYEWSLLSVDEIITNDKQKTYGSGILYDVGSPNEALDIARLQQMILTDPVLHPLVTEQNYPSDKTSKLNYKQRYQLVLNILTKKRYEIFLDGGYEGGPNDALYKNIRTSKAFTSLLPQAFDSIAHTLISPIFDNPELGNLHLFHRARIQQYLLPLLSNGTLDLDTSSNTFRQALGIGSSEPAPTPSLEKPPLSLLLRDYGAKSIGEFSHGERISYQFFQLPQNPHTPDTQDIFLLSKYDQGQKGVVLSIPRLMDPTKLSMRVESTNETAALSGIQEIVITLPNYRNIRLPLKRENDGYSSLVPTRFPDGHATSVGNIREQVMYGRPITADISFVGGLEDKKVVPYRDCAVFKYSSIHTFPLMEIPSGINPSLKNQGLIFYDDTQPSQYSLPIASCLQIGDENIFVPSGEMPVKDRQVSSYDKLTQVLNSYGLVVDGFEGLKEMIRTDPFNGFFEQVHLSYFNEKITLNFFIGRDHAKKSNGKPLYSIDRAFQVSIKGYPSSHPFIPHVTEDIHF